MTQEDAVLSDELNHASIIDGIRLCKANKYRYKHLDLNDLELKLQDAQVTCFVNYKNIRCFMDAFNVYSSCCSFNFKVVLTW